MGKLFHLDDRRTDDNFLACMERRAKAHYPLNDPEHKWVTFSINKKDYEVNVFVSEYPTMVELAWLWNTGPKLFGPAGE